MAETDYSTMTREELEQRLAQEKPDNEDREKGYTLAYVLDPKTFVLGHIPGSINIPRGKETVFEERFAKNKEIIVYSLSPECDASPMVHKELLERGFTNVHNYGSGFSYWKKSGNEVATGDV